MGLFGWKLSIFGVNISLSLEDGIVLVGEREADRMSIVLNVVLSRKHELIFSACVPIGMGDARAWRVHHLCSVRTTTWRFA